MAFDLNDLISRSEKKRKEPHTLGQKVELNTVTIEEQQRKSKNLAKCITNNKEEAPNSRRIYQVKTRLTEDEKKFFDQRVKISGLNQGDFIRQILLHESVEIHSITQTDVDTLEILSGIASELGRIGGMIRGTVIHNKGEFGILTPQEKVNLECTIRELNQLKAGIHKVVQSIYGDH